MKDKNITNSSSDREGIQTCDLPFMDERSGVPSVALAKEGYKKTKLGWIPEEWETLCIDEVFDFLSTNSFSRNQLNYDVEEGVYNIHYGDIHATYKQPILDFDNENRVPKINKDIVLSQNTDFLKDGDLVIADASEDYEGVGEAIELKNTNGKKVTSGLHTFAFRDKTNKTAEGFRVYIFRNLLVKKALKTIATGSKVYGISKGNIQKFRIVLPPLPEQQKIATILSTWDSAIAKQQQLIAAKQEFKKGLMQLVLTGKKRFAGFEGEWEEIKLDKIAYITTGCSNRVDSTLTGEFTFFDRSDDIRTSNKFLFDNEAIIVPGEGQKFVPKYFKGKFDLHQRTYAIMDFGDNNGKFLFYYLSFHNKYLLSQAVGSTVKSLRLPMFKNMKIKLPVIPEQQKIAYVLSATDKEIEILQSELAQLQGQKRGLMQKLLTGEKRVKTN